MPIREQDRSEWVQHPVTQEFLGHLRGTLEETMIDWTREAFTGSSLEQGALQNAKALGGAAVLSDIIDHITAMLVQPDVAGEYDGSF